MFHDDNPTQFAKCASYFQSCPKFAHFDGLISKDLESSLLYECIIGMKIYI